MSKITAIFFDLDNTLWDFRKNSLCALTKMFSEQKIKERFNVSFALFHSYFYSINETLWAEFRDHKIDSNHLKKERFVQAFRKSGILDETIPKYFEDNYLNEVSNFNHLVNNSLEILNYLKPHYSLHILSNGFKEVTHRKIQNSNLSSFFSSITSAEELEIRKPNPKIYEFALQKGNAKAENSAYIGDDWIADALGAKSVGMQSIFYDSLNENLSEKGIITISNLLELKNIF